MQLDEQLLRESEGYNLPLLTELLQTAGDVAHQTPSVQRARQRRSDLLEAAHVQDALGTALHDLTTAEARTEVEQLLARARALPVQTAELRVAVEAAKAAVEVQAHTKAALEQARERERAAREEQARQEEQRRQEEQARLRREREEAEREEAEREEAEREEAEREEAEREEAEREEAEREEAEREEAERQKREREAQGSTPSATAASSDAVHASAHHDADWVSTPYGNSALACLPLSERKQRLQRGTSLIKVIATDCPRIATDCH